MHGCVVEVANVAVTEVYVSKKKDSAGREFQVAKAKMAMPGGPGEVELGEGVKVSAGMFGTIRCEADPQIVNARWKSGDISNKTGFIPVRLLEFKPVK